MQPNEIADKLERLLKLATRPTAIKFYKPGEPLAAAPPEIPLNVCQLISMARHQGLSNGGVPERMVCITGAACLGLIRTPEIITSGKLPVGVYTKDEEIGRRFMAHTFKLGDTGRKYAGVVIAPLAQVEDNPDVVVVYCNPAQAMRFIHAHTYDTGDKVTADTVAEAAVCSSIGFAKATGRPVIGFPCLGDRGYGGTQNDELVFAAPYAMMRDRLVSNLEATAQLGSSVYPIAPNVAYTPSMGPVFTMRPEYLEA
ncbi:MAG: DUF169 domain-containing protein [Chloroflexi bacterium]|nr:DUF169 domain-containing protein [Chloroflexota bacterium]